jgi:PhnB protein
MTKIKTSILPWLSVRNSAKAAQFYKNAFGTTESYRMETADGGLVLRLSVNGAEFWVSGQSNDEGKKESTGDNLGGDSIKMIITADDPDTLFKRALKAGAKEIFPIGESYGWRLGRLSDPFGLHWEIGKPLTNE